MKQTELVGSEAGFFIYKEELNEKIKKEKLFMKKVFKKALSVVLSAALVFTGVSINETKQVSAAVNIDVDKSGKITGLS